MGRFHRKSWIAAAGGVIGAALAVLLCPVGAMAQSAPADLTVLPPVPTTYKPKMTSWGEPDLRGTFPLEPIDQAHIPLARPKAFGDRFWVTDAEFATRLAAAKKSDAGFSTEIGGGGTKGLAQWLETHGFARRTSMLVSPADGQLPALTPQAAALQAAGRSSWRPGQSYDGLTDFDTFDRCVSRGFPASMFPFHYNNGIRIFQSPGYVVIVLEMLGRRVIPIGKRPHWPATVRSWLGDSVGHWEGNTLVIETTNVHTGDDASPDLAGRAASPLNMATQGAPPYNAIPVSTAAKTIERLTMTDANTITYEVSYTDPQVFTAPWTARFDWTRDDSYQMFEYACNEGNSPLRGRISASQAQRAAEAAAGSGATSGAAAGKDQTASAGK